MDSETLTRRRAQRAEQRRRRALRRRLLVIGALAIAVIAVIVTIATVAGLGGSDPSRMLAAGPGHHAGTRHRSHQRLSSPARDGSPAALGPATGTPGTATVPILMYHVIAPPPAGAPFPGLYVPQPEFAAQMLALKRSGWHPVTLDQLGSYWRRGARLPGKPIVITFDNGYLSQYTHALPVLQRLHWVADENIQLAGLPPSQGGLTAAQVRALIDAGWELDTQGISHADLITLDAAQLHDQVATARAILRRRYHVPVNWFCYPSGHYNATVVAAVRAAGFVGSTTVVPGWAAPSGDAYRLPRLRVLSGTSPSALLAQIAAARGSTTTPPAYGGA